MERYILIRSIIPDILEDEVKQYLQRGYELQGGVSVTSCHDVIYYVQAMVYK